MNKAQCELCPLFNTSIDKVDKVFRSIAAQITLYEIDFYLVTIMGWKEIKSYRMHVRVLQKIVGGELYQVDLPLKRDFRDYEYAMYRVVCEVARFNNKGFLATCFMFLKPWTVQL